MTPFQILLLAILACFLLVILACLLKGWLTRKAVVVLTFVWTAATITVAWPESTSQVARSLGIGRGADLVSPAAEPLGQA